MKFLKLFSILALSVMTTSAFAAVDAKATIKVTANPSLFGDQVKLYHDASASQLVSDIPATDANSVNFYAVIGDQHYSSVKQADLSNLKLVLEANELETSYTMSFSNVLGEIIIDFEGSVEPVVISADTTLSFTLAVNTTKEFTINPVDEPTVYTRDITGGSVWGTICLPWATPNRTSLEGGKFYEALGTKNASGIALAEVDSLEAGKPYVFQATGAQIKVTYDEATEVSAEVAGNNCTGSFDGCTVPDSMYIIKSNKLYMAVGGQNTIGENRAYFDVNHMGAYTPVAGRRIVFLGAQATGFEAVKAVEGQVKKAIIDGKLIIMKGEKMYNAQGMEL